MVRLTPMAFRCTLGTAMALGILVACSTGEPAKPERPTPAALLVVDASVDEASAPVAADADVDADADAAPADTALVVGIDTASDVVADTWEIDVTTDDGKVLASDVAPSSAREIRIEAPAGRLDAKVNIKVVGHTQIEGEPDRDLGPRLATTAFVPNHTKLAYLYLDESCAYSAISMACPADQTCLDGACKPQPLGDLPDYVANWRENPPSPCSPDATPTLIFGDGNLTFTPKNDGDTMTMNCGTQGGHHVWVGLQMRGLPQHDVNVFITADAPGDAGPTPYPSAAYSSFVASSTAGTCELLNVRFQLDGSRPYTDYLGQPLDITVNAQKPGDPEKRNVTITRRVIIGTKLDPASCGQ
jgi:hypothetical protein